MKIPAKDISISKYLISLGFSPKKITPFASWFSSPLRPGDKDPSFKVDEAKNLWYDFGAGTGGSIIDLVMAYYEYSFSQAVTFLEGQTTLSFSFTGKPKAKSGTELLEISPIKSASLINYLTNERKINIKVASPFINEARYKANGNVYIAISFLNDHGGYELRNPLFKGAISPKYYTTIAGQPEGINIFEGFVDFLSALTFYSTANLKFKTIVLNSVSNLTKIPDLSSIPIVNLFLDNDQAGQKATELLLIKYPHAVNRSIQIYPYYKDFNEFLTNN